MNWVASTKLLCFPHGRSNRSAEGHQQAKRDVPKAPSEPHPGTSELTYSPLSSNGDRQIRLLILHPSTAPAGPVHCSFTYTTLRNSPAVYEAISYAWGSTTLSHVILSPSGRTSIMVTASAYAALRAVRNDRDDRILWIDGLCINQADEREKALQVGIMGCIYGQARRTLVYLGEDEEDEFQYLVYVLATCSSIRRSDDPEGGQVVESPIVKAREKVGFDRQHATLDHVTATAYWAREIEYGSQDSFPPLLDFRKWFFARPWFTRLWMMQEIALSKQVLFYFADQQILWGTIMAFHNIVDWKSQQYPHESYGHPLVSDRSILGTRIFHNFHSDDTIGPSGINFAHEATYLRHRNAVLDPPEEYYAQGRGRLTIKDHLMDLMYEMRHYKCKDPRDRLYAILSLVEDAADNRYELLRADYKASNTVAKVYGNITRCLIDQGCFDVLAAAQGLPLKESDLPSWAVNWKDPPDRDKLLTAKNIKPDELRIGLPRNFGTASLRLSPSPTARFRDGCLVLRGMPLGEITYVSAFPYKPSPIRDFDSIHRDDVTFNRVYSCWMWWDKYAHSLSELGLPVSKLPSPQTLSEKECWDEKTIKEGDPLQLLPDFTVKGVQHHCEGRTFATVGDVGISGLAHRDGKSIPPVSIPGGGGIHRIPKQLSDEDWESGWHPTRANCLVPPAAEIGDLVCGILGSGVAVVLRPEGESGQYRFVGMTTCWKLSIADAAPNLNWKENLMAGTPPAPLKDFSIY